MLKGFSVAVWNHGTGTKVNGIYIPGTLAKIKDIDVDIQPYSKALLIKNYGYDIEVNKKIYVDHFDSDLRIGTILKYTDKYNVNISMEIKAIPWDDQYMEIMCLVVI